MLAVGDKKNYNLDISVLEYIRSILDIDNDICRNWNNVNLSGVDD